MKTFNVLRSLAAAAFIALGMASTQAGETVPAKARASGQVVTRTYIADPAQVPLGTPFLHIISAGEGNGAHLGNYSITFDTWIHFEVIDGALSLVWIGTFEATAANGDILRGEFENSHPLGDNNFIGTAIFTGGTGRFEGVTGFETTVGVLYPSPDGLDTFEYVHDGWMTKGSR